MSVEEFAKLVNSNNLISEEEAKQLIESFKKISNKKIDEEEDSDSDQRKKKYKHQQKGVTQEVITKSEKQSEEKEIDDNSIER